MDRISKEELTEIWNMIFNLSIQMLHDQCAAEEATQSIFEKALQNLAAFKEGSKLSTWIYKIAYHYLIDEKRRNHVPELSFEAFENDITNFDAYKGELGLDKNEEKIFAEEIKVGCTLAMLQCLDPVSRIIYILGTIFNISGKEGASICNMTYSSYRQQLFRVKNKIRNFMMSNCGLINPDAECKCRKRILIATEQGRINSEKMLYQTENKQIRDFISEMNTIDDIARQFQNNPYIKVSNNDISRILENFKILQEISVSSI